MYITRQPNAQKHIGFEFGQHAGTWRAARSFRFGQDAVQRLAELERVGVTVRDFNVLLALTDGEREPRVQFETRDLCGGRWWG